MPSTTFFNLSVSKREKILKAAIHEFSIHLIEDVSINQIIKKSEISRGSFYMYFKDKNDLYTYLIKLQQQKINKDIEVELIKAKGDFLLAFENLYDKIIEKNHDTIHFSFFKNMFINFQSTSYNRFSLNERAFIENKKHIFKKYVNKEIYINIEDAKLLEAFCFAFLIMNMAISQTFLDLEHKQQEKERFKTHLSLLKYGIYKKEEFK